MLPDRVSNPGPLTYESGALPIALRGPAVYIYIYYENVFPPPLYYLYIVVFSIFCIHITNITDNSLFVVFSYVHLKQISHRKAFESFIQSHISVFIFSKCSGSAMVLG